MINQLRKEISIPIVIFSILVGQTTPKENAIKSFLQSNWINNPYYNYGYHIGFFNIQNDFWQATLKPAIIDSVVGKQLLGSEFSRFGTSARFQEAFIMYKNNNYYIFLGRQPNNWWQVGRRTIIQSALAPPYDQIRFGLNLWILELDMSSGQLNSNVQNNKRITRLISSHKLKMKLFNEKLLLGFGEQIIYTGEGRNVEFFYINPFVPYMFGQIDNDDLSSVGVNNDNYMLFFYGDLDLMKKINVYWELIIDDYQYNPDPIQDMLGWKIGVSGELSISSYILNWESNYNQIDSWTYIHSGQFTTWENHGHAMGYLYGGDLKSFRLQADSWLKRNKVWFHMEYTWLEKGTINIQTQSANSGTLSDPFPYPPVKVFHMFESSITYHTKYASLQAGYTNVPIPYEIANGLIEELKDGLFFNLKLKIGFDFKFDQSQIK
tara:strand:- start:3672 stop:4976 length:1305 start_codon:yes stop_codon:yes gene_type:complete